MPLSNIEALRLTPRYDAAALRADLRFIRPEQWVPHFNKAIYEGDWSGVALRGPAGATHPIQALYPNPTVTRWADTEILSRLKYIPRLLADFHCPLCSVRLLRLGPGATIKEHSDYNLGFEDGEVRIHVPITTHPEVEFILNGRRVIMSEGEPWYLNFNLPHRLANPGPSDRIHLVIDCRVNPWLQSCMETAAAENAPTAP